MVAQLLSLSMSRKDVYYLNGGLKQSLSLTLPPAKLTSVLLSVSLYLNTPLSHVVKSSLSVLLELAGLTTIDSTH